MRQLTLLPNTKFEWHDAPPPSLQDDQEAIVEPVAVARCDLDTRIADGRIPYEKGCAFGHETVARVLEVGDAVTAVKPGQIVVVPVQISCGTCDRCRKGATRSCRSVPRGSVYGLACFGGTEWGGGLSEQLRVPFADAMLVPVPDGIEPAVLAAAADNLPDGFRTVAGPLANAPGAEVLVVTGEGSCGLYAAASALALGAAKVDYVSSDTEALELARALGANPIEMRPERGQDPVGRYPITVCYGPRMEDLNFAISCTAHEGTLTSAAMLFGPMELEMHQLYLRGITLVTGPGNARTNIPRTLELVVQGALPASDMVTARVPWTDAAEAMGEPSTKMVFVRAES